MSNQQQPMIMTCKQLRDIALAIHGPDHVSVSLIRQIAVLSRSIERKAKSREVQQGVSVNIQMSVNKSAIIGSTLNPTLNPAMAKI